MEVLNTIVLGLNLFVVMYGLTVLLCRKQQPQQRGPR